MEWHANLRFAWYRKKIGGEGPPKRVFTHPLHLITMVYNLVWWVPVILPFTPVMNYHDGFLAFFGVTAFRLVANLIRNNVLKFEAAEDFPLRA